MSLKKNIIFNIILSVTQILFPIISFPYASRILGPTGIGKVSFADSVTQYLILISFLGIPIYGVREISKYRNRHSQLKQIFSEIVVIHFFSTLLSLILFIVSICFINKFKTDFYLYVIGCGIVFFNFFVIDWLFQGLEKFKYITSRTVLFRIFSLVALFLLVKNKSDIITYYAINLATIVLNGVINFNYGIKLCGFTLKNLNIKRHLRPLIIIFVSNLAISAYVLFDNIFLGFLSNANSVGFYSTAVKICRIFVTLIGAIGTVIIPRIAGISVNDNLDEIKRILRRTFELVVFISIPICVGIIATSSEIIKIFAGDEFYPAHTALSIISFLPILIGLSNIFGIQILASLGYERKLMISVITGMLVSILLNFILIPKFAFLGASYTLIITEGIVAILTFWFSKKVIKLSFDWKKLLLTFLICSPFILICYLIDFTFQFSLLENLMLKILFCSIYYITATLFAFKSSILKDIIIEWRLKNKSFLFFKDH